MKNLFAGLLFFGAACFGAETYHAGPDSLPQSGVPHGTVVHGVLAPGKYYPGTPHNFAYYVPANPPAGKPLPYMVFLDGSGALSGLHVPTVLDNLIAKHELPAMAAIFVDPGVLPTVAAQAQHRYERIFEYDSTSDRFSHFLLEELIPEVARHQALSANPDDHGIAGVSTGAVGAFVAAWQRPDQFHRVLSLIGTFVDMKGAEELASLVRKTEPRPLRILLQDGKNDHLAPDQPWGTFYAGSWPINNQVLWDALRFAGYDAKLVFGDGAHDTKQGSAMMPDALRWLWANYPAPIAVHEPTPTPDPRGRVYAIVFADRPWELVSPAAHSVTCFTGDRDGTVFFADRESGFIYRLSPDGTTANFRARTSGLTALHLAANGRLYAAEPERQRIVSFGSSGDEQIAARGMTVSDLALTAEGSIYFIDSVTKQMGLVRPDGQVVPAAAGFAIADPAALALSPDQSMLVVTDRQSRYSWSFQIGSDGALINGEPFYRLYMPELAAASSVTGAAFDASGQVYFASPLGIQVTEQNGRTAAVLNGPNYSAVSAVGFAGKELGWLYAISNGQLFRRPTRVAGVGVWNRVVPPKPPL